MIPLRAPTTGEYKLINYIVQVDEPFILNEGDIIFDIQHHETWNSEKESKIIVGDGMTVTVLRKLPPPEEA